VPFATSGSLSLRLSSPSKCLEPLRNPLIRDKLQEVPGWRVILPRDFVECSELAGKTVKAAKLYDDLDGSCEVVFEFTDGTSFTCSVEHQLSMKSSLFRERVGTPEIIREYGT